MEKSNLALIVKVDKFRTIVHQIWGRRKEKIPIKNSFLLVKRKKLSNNIQIGEPGTLGTKVDHRYVHLSDRQARECFLKCLENDVLLRGSVFSNTFCEATAKVFFFTFLHHTSCPNYHSNCYLIHWRSIQVRDTKSARPLHATHCVKGNNMWARNVTHKRDHSYIT